MWDREKDASEGRKMSTMHVTKDMFGPGCSMSSHSSVHVCEDKSVYNTHTHTCVPYAQCLESSSYE